MDQIHLQFLDILRAALRGEPARTTEDLTPAQLEQVLQLAVTHHVLPMVYEVVYTLPSVRSAGQGVMAAYKHQVLRNVSTQAMKTSSFLSTLSRLHAAGIRPLVVKGLICRQLYPNPDYRASGDEDILIQPAWFDDCHRVLTDCGMVIPEEIENPADSCEIPYGKPGSMLYIEVHKHLFPPESNAYGDFNRFFEGVFDRVVEEQIQGVPVRTMGHTDHFFYLICHAFKHFLHSGFGIRQVCDILLYAETYGSRIDWALVLDNCCAIHAEQFCAALFRIGEEYLDFDVEKACLRGVWRTMAVDAAPMLEDLLGSGLYGDANLSRKHSSGITLNAVAAQRQGKQSKNRLTTSLFLPLRSMQARFPYLKKAPWLLPVAWIHRVIRFGLETRKTQDNNAAEALKIGSQRVELMRYYGIIK